MKTLYQAANNVEAHMILNLLEQEGLAGRVDGEYLQGAVGELPAAGLVKVMVSEQDYAAAKLIVDKWDAIQPEQSPQPPVRKPHNRFGMFAMGLSIGILCTYAYYRTPVANDGVDYNRDGVLDEKWTYAPSGRLAKSEYDRNLDGKIDCVSTFGSDGTIESSDADDNFDGIFESRTMYRLGNPLLTETDTDGDGYRDFKTQFVNGVIVSIEYIYPATGLPHKIEYLKFGKLVYSENDTDKDGKMNTRTNYNAFGDVTSTASIQ